MLDFPLGAEMMGDQGTIRNNQVFSTRWTGQKGWATFPTILPDSGEQVRVRVRVDPA